MAVKSHPWWLRLLVGQRPVRTLLRAVLLAVFCVVFFRFVLIPVRIVGGSMDPTYRDGQVNLVSRWSYLWSEPHRCDVVGIKSTGERVLYLKRIVALPGETCAIINGIVYINGRALDEPYVKRRTAWSEPPRLLSSTNYLVIGDNRSMGQNFHLHGRVARHKILGKLIR